MREQSPDQYDDNLEHQSDRKKRLRALLVDIVLSSVMIASSSNVRTAFEEIHRTDSLPHN
jgi:hypothetical protein